jgi:hypothetical protein
MARPSRVSDLLYAGIGGEKFQERLAQFRVMREWGAVVGERIDKVSRPVSFRNGTLTVAVRGAVWKTEIDYLKGEIVDTINHRLGKSVLTGVRLTTSFKGIKADIADPVAASADESQIVLRGRDKRRIGHAVASISDDTLREAITKAWESKKKLDERRRLAGWRSCRSCGQFDAWTAGICRACALDINAMPAPHGDTLAGEGS